LFQIGQECQGALVGTVFDCHNRGIKVGHAAVPEFNDFLPEGSFIAE
jgi:hypothetical protein